MNPVLQSNFSEARYNHLLDSGVIDYHRERIEAELPALEKKFMAFPPTEEFGCKQMRWFIVHEVISVILGLVVGSCINSKLQREGWSARVSYWGGQAIGS